MYGSNTLNNQLIIRYSLTKEFFDTFQVLTHMGIPIPYILHRQFQARVKSYINKKQTNHLYITMLNNKHSFTTSKQVQECLSKYQPSLTRDLSRYPHRKWILIPGRYASFVVNYMENTPVLFSLTTLEDQRAIDKQNIPDHMKIFNYNEAHQNELIKEKHYALMYEKAKEILHSSSEHPLFKKKYFSKWLLRNLKPAMQSIQLLDRVIRKYPVRVIAERSEIVEPGLTLSLLGCKYGLPFVYIPPLLLGNASFLPSRATHFCAWGKNQNDWFVSRGIERSSIYNTGNLKFEYDYSPPSITKKELYKTYKIPQEHEIVLYTTQPFHSSTNSITEEWLIDKRFSNLPFTILIKRHPSDRINYSFIQSGTKNVKIVDQDTPLYNVLSHASLVMTVSSNTAIEAALLNKGILVLQPTIPYNFNLNPCDYHQHLVKASAGPPVYNADDLYYCLYSFHKDPAFRQSLLSYSNTFLKDTLEYTKSPSIEVKKVLKKALIDSKY